MNKYPEGVGGIFLNLSDGLFSIFLTKAREGTFLNLSPTTREGTFLNLSDWTDFSQSF
jgi:hypothetical protein